MTDLGTEFGVEVNREGITETHVFRGSVKLQLRCDNVKSEDATWVLHEDQSARVEKPKGLAGDRPRVVVRPLAPRSAAFVRQIAKPKIFDLVDAISGGNGFTGRRGFGIRPITDYSPEPAESPKPDQPWCIWGDYKYHRYMERFIDGMFIPDGSKGPVQVDSVGHTFADFPKTANSTSCDFWAGGIVPTDEPQTPRSKIGGVDYALHGHGVLFMHANKGITFDLAAIRRANPDCSVVRFLAVTGNAEPATEQGPRFAPMFGCWSMVRSVSTAGRSIMTVAHYRWPFRFARMTVS